MELFQQYKTIKDGNIVTADTKYAMTKKKEVEHEFIPAPGIKKKLSLEPTEVIKSNTNFPLNKWNPNIFPPKFASLMPLEQNYINIPIMRNTPKHRSNLTPVMIQTNSNEIPPLVLPMSKPLKLINQNIIVTTKVPYELIKNNSSHWSSRLKNQGNVYSNSNFKYNKEKSQYISANNRDRTIPYQRLKASYKDNPMHDHQGYEYSNFNNNHGEYAYNRDDVINSNVDHNGMHNRVSVNYRTGHEINDNSHTRLNYGQRFHERLERGDDWLPNYNDNKYKVENREGCCKMKVASRQQLPLNSVKKQTKYDDIHFKNFLKTQQKVNDMLERILATKTKSDGPRSVETP
ncbi:uncharacterized protein LOC128201943 [Galleria mellonella]|uniref:Uncharacterized protein LOC128201943 n=1 Tax=Galleria mellonella TaxID=7137 RepID=A0ABM3MYE5_GALME|nr:uncharacterized protein LOC128201943 [Galleria mellonella]